MKWTLLAVSLVTANLSWAFDLPVGIASDKIIRGQDFALDRFEGIVKLSNCSGSLIKFEGMPESAKAVVMTNGHCIQKPGGYLNPGEVWVNRPIKRGMKIFDKEMNLFSVSAKKIIFATMTATDLALYELEETYKEIKDEAGIEPLLLSDLHPTVGTKVQIVSGYWERTYDCDINGFVHRLLEGDWEFKDSVRYNAGCDTIGGTSGSPVIEAETRTVVAIHNTGNDDGQQCTQNNPCEVDPDGTITVRQGNSYAQQSYQVYNCLTKDYKLDLTLPTCELPKPTR